MVAGNGEADMNRAITSALIIVSALLLVGCGKKDVGSVVAASNGRGGVILFSASNYRPSYGLDGLLSQATETCNGGRAIPIGFYKITSDSEGRDQVMTFECK